MICLNKTIDLTHIKLSPTLLSHNKEFGVKSCKFDLFNIMLVDAFTTIKNTSLKHAARHDLDRLIKAVEST
jgi:hypothetical protein